jgi:FtsP/CotA-like multicopper oxidase with cupredoxin domain
MSTVTKHSSRRIACVAAVLALPVASALAAGGPGALRIAQDLNPDPKILEVNLTAQTAKIDIDGKGLIANAFTYDGGIPGPQLRANVGDTVIVHFENRLPEPTLVHWHGIELDNANDGTTVTQDLVPTGGKFTYRFHLSRPGVFWYHPHAMPTNQLFKGLYGSIIVEDPDTPTLVKLGVLPDESRTWTLQLSDITVCREPGKNDAVTFRGGADVAWAFTKEYGPFPGLAAWPSPRDLCETPRDDHGMPTGKGPLAAGDIPNIQPAANCLPPKVPCRVNEGQHVLTNGRVAAARAGTPEQPGALAKNADALSVRAGEGVRLHVLNSSGARYYRLRLTDQQGKDVPIMRIGGQGGLLDRVRLEGGQLGTIGARYDVGEIAMGPAERVDVVVIAQGKPGDVMTLWTEDFQHYGTADYPFGYGALPTVPVAHLRIEGGKPRGGIYKLASGDPLRVHPAVNHPTPSLHGATKPDPLVDPAKLTPALPGSKNPLMLLAVVGRESIDGVHGMALEGTMDPAADHRQIPHIDSTRYARVGDLLELTVRNGTQMHHPWHLHGFSFQPIRLEDSLGNLVHEYDYNEFVDTWDVPATHRLIFRVRLEDRGAVAGPASGGAVGRWMMHCHIFHHNGVGMMTELVVLPQEQAVAGSREGT